MEVSDNNIMQIHVFSKQAGALIRKGRVQQNESDRPCTSQ